MLANSRWTCVVLFVSLFAISAAQVASSDSHKKVKKDASEEEIQDSKKNKKNETKNNSPLVKKEKNKAQKTEEETQESKKNKKNETKNDSPLGAKKEPKTKKTEEGKKVCWEDFEDYDPCGSGQRYVTKCSITKKGKVIELPSEPGECVD